MQPIRGMHPSIVSREGAACLDKDKTRSLGQRPVHGLHVLTSGVLPAIHVFDRGRESWAKPCLCTLPFTCSALVRTRCWTIELRRFTGGHEQG